MQIASSDVWQRRSVFFNRFSVEP